MTAAQELSEELYDVWFLVGLIEEGIQHAAGECLPSHKLREEEVSEMVSFPCLG